MYVIVDICELCVCMCVNVYVCACRVCVYVCMGCVYMHVHACVHTAFLSDPQEMMVML